MYNIKYMGRYKDESQILRGKLSKHATQYDEPDDVREIFLRGMLVSLPFILILLGLIFFKLKIMDVSLESFFGSPIFLALSLLIATFLSTILIVAHELLHTICFPKEYIKEIWVKPESLAAFVYCNGVVSKGRFIWISFCPNVVLGFIPYALWLTGLFDFNQLLSQTVIILAMLNILGGIGDYYNVYTTIRQVPKNALVQNYGFHTFWFLKEL